MVGLVGAMVSFAEGHELLHELAGVEVEVKQVERTAEALGRAIAADERRAARRRVAALPFDLQEPVVILHDPVVADDACLFEPKDRLQFPLRRPLPVS